MLEGGEHRRIRLGGVGELVQNEHMPPVGKEGGKRRTRTFADMDEARMIAQQITVRLKNGSPANCEVTRRDLELLRHCEQVAKSFGVTLAAAIEALETLERFRKGSREIGHRRGESVALATLGSVYDVLGERRRAEECLDAARAIAERNPFISSIRVYEIAD